MPRRSFDRSLVSAQAELVQTLPKPDAMLDGQANGNKALPFKADISNLNCPVGASSMDQDLVAAEGLTPQQQYIIAILDGAVAFDQRRNELALDLDTFHPDSPRRELCSDDPDREAFQALGRDFYVLTTLGRDVGPGLTKWQFEYIFSRCATCARICYKEREEAHLCPQRKFSRGWDGGPEELVTFLLSRLPNKGLSNTELCRLFAVFEYYYLLRPSSFNLSAQNVSGQYKNENGRWQKQHKVGKAGEDLRRYRGTNVCLPPEVFTLELPTLPSHGIGDTTPALYAPLNMGLYTLVPCDPRARIAIAMDLAEIARLTAQLVDHYETAYTSPQLSRVWLRRAIDAIMDETEMPFFDVAHVTHALEQRIFHSRLEDITVPGTGLRPPTSRILPHGILHGPILLEIVHIEEVGVSAFELESVRQERARIKHQRRIEQVRRIVTPREDDAIQPRPILPVYPRSRIKVYFTDGFTLLEAVECERLPDIVLGETPMGRKVSLENAPIIAGVAHLHPANVTVHDGAVRERKLEHSVRMFRELKIRMKEELSLVRVREGPPIQTPVTPSLLSVLPLSVLCQIPVQYVVTAVCVDATKSTISPGPAREEHWIAVARVTTRQLSLSAKITCFVNVSGERFRLYLGSCTISESFSIKDVPEKVRIRRTMNRLGTLMSSHCVANSRQISTVALSCFPPFLYRQLYADGCRQRLNAGSPAPTFPARNGTPTKARLVSTNDIWASPVPPIAPYRC
ncbi:hypothetical protein NMY22_g5783 [Coprinellus aureogranulatus]|nr:hypothetical protein NMY22_g5783 [Coprinellus aureogranulatus]